MAISILRHSVGHTHGGEVKKERRARKRLTYFRGLDSGNTHLSESECVKGREMGVCGS